MDINASSELMLQRKRLGGYHRKSNMKYNASKFNVNTKSLHAHNVRKQSNLRRFYGGEENKTSIAYRGKIDQNPNSVTDSP